jgi:hypothetical protein
MSRCVLVVRCPGSIAITNEGLDHTCRYEASQNVACSPYRLALCLSFLHIEQDFNGHATNPVRATLTNAETKTRGPPTEPRSDVSCQIPQLQTAICWSFRQLHAHLDLPVLVSPAAPINTTEFSTISQNTTDCVAYRHDRSALK